LATPKKKAGQTALDGGQGSSPPPTQAASSKDSGSDMNKLLTVTQYKERMKRRLFRSLNYASIAFTYLIAYGSFLIADYLLLSLCFWLFRDEIHESRLVSDCFYFLKIGLALLVIPLFATHGLRAAWAQYKLDAKLVKEEE
jgi:hypothetical protein